MTRTLRNRSKPNLRSKTCTLTAPEIITALLRETNPRARRRLKALLALCHGRSLQEAARAVMADPSSVTRWIHIAQSGGLAALTAREMPNRRYVPMSDAAKVEARAEIAKALKRRPNWRLRLRLEAVDARLAGASFEVAAKIALVRAQTVKDWEADIRLRGIVQFLEKREPRSYAPRLDLDCAALRELAAREINPRIRKRILAVAHVAEGMGIGDASVAAGLDHKGVKLWVERARRDGLGVFRATE